MTLRALILAAGLGTRLRPLTFVRAKAAVPVNGDPLVRRVIRWLAGQGIHDLLVNLHHRPASIAAVVGDGQDLGARVRYSWENPVLGSAGGPRHALSLLVDGLAPEDQRFLIVNGDTLTDVNLARVVETHLASGALVTMAVIPNAWPDKYGGVLVDQGRVQGFTRRGARKESFHFIGVQIAEARVFAHLPDGAPAESVMGVYADLIQADPTAVAACVAEAGFRDVGTPADYLQACLEFVALEGDRLVQSTDVAATARVRRTAVWDRVTIGADARLEECIVCDGADIPAGATYRRAAIAPHTGEELQEGERLDGTLVIRNF